MKDDRITRLNLAIETGEVIQIIYHGGSQPGTSRQIAPMSIKNGKVRARCYNSNAIKQFMIEKVELVNEETPPKTTNWNRDVAAIPHYKSIESLLEKTADTLTALGWHIERNLDRISLHGRFKNGKPKKGADISLAFEEYTWIDFVDEDGNEFKEATGKKKRPWCVRSTETTKSFGSLDKAAAAFMKYAELSAPTP
ncbi:hypothetical protein DJ031_04530 [bacterium endosymbiont of Escarpia laminata]|nr:MAG: hypothetical protein DJ031_04530 [bacterium endosymbiont of Escarpia laminata]